MGSMYDDYEEFDELRFEDVAHRRPSKGKHRRGAKAAGRKHKRSSGHGHWDAQDWDEIDEYDDYNDVEFDAHYRSTIDH